MKSFVLQVQSPPVNDMAHGVLFSISKLQRRGQFFRLQIFSIFPAYDELYKMECIK